MSFLYCFSVVCFFINNEKSNYAASIVSFSRISEVLTALKVQQDGAGCPWTEQFQSHKTEGESQRLLVVSPRAAYFLYIYEYQAA
jgi:hypothetical protein